jgi:ATP-binding cassette, subfamily C (CFTR/MRP), member 1
LIDDALSALDAYVGKKIMDQVFMGELKQRTRVMVTHYLHLLDKVDRVIFVENGKIIAQGLFEDVKKIESFKAFAQGSGGQLERDGKLEES